MARRTRIFLLLLPTVLVAGIVGLFLYKHRNDKIPPEAVKSRLVVVAVFDQFRGDYLERWSAHYGSDGFEKMKRDGAWFANAHLPYANTSTGPGHASISTGVPPRVHGIVENVWYDRKTNAKAYCAFTSDRYTSVPSLGSKSVSFAPEHLCIPTVGEALLKAREKSSRVYSLALKDRSAALMGGRNPTGAFCFDNTTGLFHTSTYYTDQLPAWVDEFNKKKTSDTWWNTQWTRLKDDATYVDSVGLDDQPGEFGGSNGEARVFPHPLDRGGAPGSVYYKDLEVTPFGNALVWDLAKSCISSEKLGKQGKSDLLFIGFSSNDLIGHTYGPDSHEVMDAAIRTDLLVAEMITYLDETIGKDQYTLIITADHGICPIPEKCQKEHPGAERFELTRELAGLGSALDLAFGPVGPNPEQDWFYTIDYPEVYLNRRVIAERGISQEAVEEYAAKWIAERSRMHAAYPRSEVSKNESSDPMLRQFQQSYYADRSGDIFVVTKAGYQPYGRTSGTNHGSPWPYDTHVPVLVYGRSIPKMPKSDEKVSSLIVAPIICHSLGIDPPGHLAEKLPKALTVIKD